MSATPMCMPTTMATSMRPMARNPIISSLMAIASTRGGLGAVAQVLPGQQAVLHGGEHATERHHQGHGPGREGEHALDADELVVVPGLHQQRPRGIRDDTAGEDAEEREQRPQPQAGARPHQQEGIDKQVGPAHAPVAQRAGELQEHDDDDGRGHQLGHAVDGLVEGVAHEHVGTHQHHDQADHDRAQAIEPVDQVAERAAGHRGGGRLLQVGIGFVAHGGLQALVPVAQGLGAALAQFFHVGLHDLGGRAARGVGLHPVGRDVGHGAGPLLALARGHGRHLHRHALVGALRLDGLERGLVALHERGAQRLRVLQAHVLDDLLHLGRHLVEAVLVHGHAAVVERADVHRGHVGRHLVDLVGQDAGGDGNGALAHAGLDVGVVAGERAVHRHRARAAQPCAHGAGGRDLLAVQVGVGADRGLGEEVVGVHARSAQEHQVVAVPL
eukprot:Opistho-1_new@73584